MNRAFQKDQPFKQQADMLASKGRYGDSMLVHMNPREVDVLRSMTPNNALTINPDTGQPEAFLPLLLALGGGLLGATAPIGALGVLGGATGLAAIGSGVGTAIETGSLEEGLKAGLLSGVLGGIGGKFLGGTLGGAGGATAAEGTTQAATQALTDASTQAATQAGLGQVIGKEGIDLAAKQGLEAIAAPTLASTAQAVSQPAITEVAKQNILQQIGSGLADITPTQLGSIGTAALTGQGLTDQYNLMNMPLGMADDDEDFYVPVTPDDRGVRFPASGRGGRSSEMDYFANPFSFTQQFQQGGPVDFSDFDPNAPLVGISGPQFFTNAPEVIGTETVQQFVPRAQDTQFNLGTRGFADAPVIDYSARLLGDPTLTRNIYGTTSTADTGNTADTATTAGQGTGAGGDPTGFGDPNAGQTSGINTSAGTGESVTTFDPAVIGDSSFTGNFMNPFGMTTEGINEYLDDYLADRQFITQDEVSEQFQTFDPMAGFDPTAFVTQDDLSATLQGFDPMAGLNTSDFLTTSDLNTALSDFNPQIDTSQFVTATDLNTALTGFNPGIDTSSFATQADLAATAFDPTGLQTQIDALSAAPAATTFDPTALQTQIDALSTQLADLSKPSAGMSQSAALSPAIPTNIARLPFGMVA